MAEIVPSDKTGERMDIMVIIQILKLEKDKTATVLAFFKLNLREKNVGERCGQWSCRLVF